MGGSLYIEGIVFIEAELVEVCQLVNSPYNFNLNGSHRGRVAVHCTQKARCYGDPDRRLSAKTRPLQNAGERQFILKEDVHLWLVICT